MPLLGVGVAQSCASAVMRLQYPDAIEETRKTGGHKSDIMRLIGEIQQLANAPSPIKKNMQTHEIAQHKQDTCIVCRN